MIIKKVRADRAKTKQAHIRDLTNYLLDPSTRNAGERVLYADGRGFLCEEPIGQQAEMIALAQEAPRSKNPIAHWIMSWREGEQPTPKQVEEAVSVFLVELGLEGHQAVYALHSDTDNIHLHLAINRVHPDTLKVIKPNRGFDIEAAHRAIAKIEHVQGWQREANGRYEVLENGKVGRAEKQKKEQREPSQKARDMEARTGQKSAERIAIDEAAKILRDSKSWAEVHRQLAERGMKLERKGSGAVLWVGETPVKASSAGRDCGLSALQKRLGAFEAKKEGQKEIRREPEPLKGRNADWAEYGAERKRHYAEKDKEWQAQRKRQDTERRTLSERQKNKREEVLGGSWRGRGELLNALRSTLAAQQAAEKAELKDKHQHERKALKERFGRFLDFEEWLRLDRGETAAGRWRYRDSEQASLEGEQFDAPKIRDIRSFIAEMYRGCVRYRRGEAQQQEVAFVDRGKQIDMHEAHEPDSILAALQLAAQKWGSVSVNGTEEYKRQCVELAVEHGFRIVNPELQEALAAERARRQQQQTRPVEEAPKPPRKPRMETASRPAATPAEVYRRHYEDIRKRQGGALDLSRVDAMISIRMRLTGHSQKDIALALVECAPGARGQLEVRNWKSYAERTVRYAFGAGGDEQLARLAKYRGIWLKLEGREWSRGRQAQRQRKPQVQARSLG